MRHLFFAAAALMMAGISLASAEDTPATAAAIPITTPPDKIAPPIDAGAGVAPEEVIDSIGGGAIPALPLQPYVAGDIHYVSGGVGDEEMEQLKAIGRDYNVHVMLSSKDGAYVANIGLRVLGAAGQEVLAISGAGPYVYIKLPPGNYTLEATRNGETKKAGVKAPAAGAARPHFTFSG